MKSFKIKYKESLNNGIEKKFYIIDNNNKIKYIIENTSFKIKDIDKSISRQRIVINSIVEVPNETIIFAISIYSNGITNFITISLENKNLDYYYKIKKEIKNIFPAKYHFIKLSEKNLKPIFK